MSQATPLKVLDMLLIIPQVLRNTYTVFMDVNFAPGGYSRKHCIHDANWVTQENAVFMMLIMLLGDIQGNAIHDVNYFFGGYSRKYCIHLGMILP